LLELSPERAIDRLATMVATGKFDRWFLSIVTQRLYAYYTTRPLGNKVKQKFEKLTADLELRMAGKTARGNEKGFLMNKMKKKAFKPASKMTKD
jgi:hypothetical protein